MSTIRVKRSTGNTGPSGLTFGEPAFVDGLNSLYITKNNGTSMRVGAELDTSGSLGTSDNKIPTQKAVKTYVDASVAGGAVSSVNGLTGAVTIYGGSGISVAAAGGGITLTNTGVVSAVAGTGISVSGATGAVTFTNNGVLSVVAGNQITVSGATGAVTIGVTANPSFATITTTGDSTIGGKLTVTGNLVINGTSTIVNSNTMTIDDPMIVLGLSGSYPLTVSDGGKDRGIAFTYYSDYGGAGYTGFFGYDASANQFVALARATIASDIVTSFTDYLDIHGKDILVHDNQSDANVHYGKFTTDSILSDSRTYTLPDHSGTVVVPSDLGTTNYILKSAGAAAQPTWINPNSSGFTAFAATQLATARTFSLTGNVTATGITFDGTGNVTLSTTIANDSVALGTQTTGNYARDVSVAGLGLTISGAVGEGTQYIITSGATSANTASQIVARDASGNFSAGTITASLTGLATTATALQTSRTFSLTGNVTATGITFDGTGNVALSTTIGSGVVTNAMLVNSGFTLGTTNIALGSTGLTLAGLSSVTATTFNGSLSGTATTATNVTLTEATSANTTDLYPTFIANGATGGLLIDVTPQSGLVALSYRPSTGILTAYKVEAIVDGGSY